MLKPWEHDTPEPSRDERRQVQRAFEELYNNLEGPWEHEMLDILHTALADRDAGMCNCGEPPDPHFPEDFADCKRHDEIRHSEH